tara:strand:+ start:4415 stop:5077 length:663 start_codon:yes stop_codon:yes gene_type:complete
LKFDPQEGYIEPRRNASMPSVSVYDDASQSMVSVRLKDAYDNGYMIAELNVTPVTQAFLMAVKETVPESEWDKECDFKLTTQMSSVIFNHFSAAQKAPDPFIFIASFAYQANKFAPKQTESADRFAKYLARVVTVYLKSHGYYMPDTIYSLLVTAIATTSAARIDKVIKGIHIQIPIGSFGKYLNQYEQLHESHPVIDATHRITTDFASRVAQQLSISDK